MLIPILSFVVGGALLALLLTLFIRQGKIEEEDMNPNIRMMKKIRAYGDPAIISLFENAGSDQERAEIVAFVDAEIAKTSGKQPETNDNEDTDDDEDEDDRPRRRRGLFGRKKDIIEDEDEDTEDSGEADVDDETDDTSAQTLDIDPKEDEDDIGLTTIMQSPAYNFWKDPAIVDEPPAPAPSVQDDAPVISEAAFEPTMIISKEELSAAALAAQAANAAAESPDLEIAVDKMSHTEEVAEVDAEPVMEEEAASADITISEPEPAPVETEESEEPELTIAEVDADNSETEPVEIEEPESADTAGSEPEPVEVEDADTVAAVAAETPAEAEKLCSACGNPIEDDNAFCIICGTPVTAPAVPVPDIDPIEFTASVPLPVKKSRFRLFGRKKEAEETAIETEPATEPTTDAANNAPIKLCASCGSELTDENAFCTTCGASIAGSATPQPVVSLPPVETASQRDIWNDNAAPKAATSFGYISGAPIGTAAAESSASQQADPQKAQADPDALAAYQASIAAARAAAQARGVWSGADDDFTAQPLREPGIIAPAAKPVQEDIPAAAPAETIAEEAANNPFVMPDGVTPVAEVVSAVDENTISLKEILENVKALEDRLFAEALNKNKPDKNE